MSRRVIIYDMEPRWWEAAAVLAKSFAKDFPDKMGMRDGCAYGPSRGREISMYVYRTKDSLVVRGQGGAA